MKLTVFEVVTQFVQLYTLCYVEEDTVLLHEILRDLGSCVRGGGVCLARAVCGFEELPVFPAISVTFIIFICIITASLMAAVWQRTTANEASG